MCKQIMQLQEFVHVGIHHVYVRYMETVMQGLLSGFCYVEYGEN